MSLGNGLWSHGPLLHIQVHSRAQPSQACTHSLAEHVFKAWRSSKAILCCAVGLWKLFSVPIPAVSPEFSWPCLADRPYNMHSRQSDVGTCLWGDHGVGAGAWGAVRSTPAAWPCAGREHKRGQESFLLRDWGTATCLPQDSHWQWPPFLKCAAPATAVKANSFSSPATAQAAAAWRTWPRRRHSAPSATVWELTPTWLLPVITGSASTASSSVPGGNSPACSAGCLWVPSTPLPTTVQFYCYFGLSEGKLWTVQTEVLEAQEQAILLCHRMRWQEKGWREWTGNFFWDSRRKREPTSCRRRDRQPRESTKKLLEYAGRRVERQKLSFFPTTVKQNKKTYL